MMISIIGLDNMSVSIANCLRKNNFEVQCFENNESRIKQFKDQKINISTDLKKVISSAQYIFSFATDPDLIYQAILDDNGLSKYIKEETIFISNAYITPKQTEEIHNKFKEKNIKFLSSTVMGAPEDAMDGKLTTLVAGDESLASTLKALMTHYSEEVIYLGKNYIDVNLIKICVNYFAVAYVETFSEIFSYSKSHQFNMKDLYGILQEIQPYFNRYIGKMLSENYEPKGFNMEAGLHDTNLMQSAFFEAGVSCEIIDTVKRKMQQGVNQGLSDLDWTAIHKLTLENAGQA